MEGEEEDQVDSSCSAGWGKDVDFGRLRELARLCRGDILTMTNIAGSGHPGGSMSSLDIYLTLFSVANVDPKNPYDPARDRIVVSHGHTSPGVYSVLGRLGFIPKEEVLSLFRRGGSPYEGHVERSIPGVEWTTGNLGQGLSAGCGFALASRLLGIPYHVFVVMSDAEQAKGQVAEARRFAIKHEINNITVIIDYNEIQISGSVHDVMPVNIAANYASDGWKVMEVDGHDHEALCKAILEARDLHSPVVIIAKTTIGKGVSFMEGKEEYHGRALNEDEFQKALKELDVSDYRNGYRKKREEFVPEMPEAEVPIPSINVDVGTPFSYRPGDKIDNRAAFGKALVDLGKRNCGKEGHTPIAVFDCDLADSVRTGWFSREKDLAPYFFEAGVAEHNAATVAGSLSSQGVVAFFGDFGVFGIDEVYNQQRLNDINHANIKLILTHLGLDVGQDGKTHHCIDYIGLLRNLFGFRLILPADANQMDRAVRYVSERYGNYAIGMGRSSQPIITDLEGEPLFGEGYSFKYGAIDLVREGGAATIISYGQMLHRAILAWEALKKEGIEVTVLNCSSPLHPEEGPLLEAAERGPVFVYEDHNAFTGLGCVVGGVYLRHRISVNLHCLGVSTYAPSGEPEILYQLQGLAPEQLAERIREEIG